MGTFERTLDKRGRVRVNEEITKGTTRFDISVCRDGCLVLTPVDNDGGYKVDRKRRLFIPFRLRRKGGLSREVVLVGCDTYIEIWSKDRWKKEINKTKEVLADISWTR